MLRRAWARTIGGVAGILCLTACGGRAVGLPTPDDVVAPTFATLPADLAASPQLAALALRDTAGLAPEALSALATQLPAAVAAVMEVEPRPSLFTRVSIYDRSVFFSWKDPSGSNRSSNAVYYPQEAPQSEELYVSGPDFDDEPSFSLDGVDLTVPAALVDAIERRFHGTVIVTDIDLRVGLSYGFGLVWNLGVADARGHLATVFADLDGAIVAVDT